MGADVETAAQIVSGGGVVALAILVWLTVRASDARVEKLLAEHAARMEKREARTADVMEAFVSILSRVEVRVGLDVPRRNTPVRGVAQRSRARDTDPEDEGEGDGL